MSENMELLPLPKRLNEIIDACAPSPFEAARIGAQVRDYARANLVWLNNGTRKANATLRLQLKAVRSKRYAMLEENKRIREQLDRVLAERGQEFTKLMRRAEQAEARAKGLAEALRLAVAALADIGDADREPGDDLAWCERRAAKDLPTVRAALKLEATE